MMDRQNAKQWLRVFGDTPDDLKPPCRHGHPECSITPQGECFDEVIQAACGPSNEAASGRGGG